MRLRVFIIYICTLLLAVTVSAVPARKGPIILSQPDGTAFTARLQGDEFNRIRTTTQGHAIIQDKDGWWCYAIYDTDGSRHCTEWRVGHDVPQEVLNQSLNIPRASLAREARLKRQLISQQHILSTPTRSLFQSRAIVILAQFKDIKFVNTKEDFEALLMSDGYTRNGATGSAREYFEYQFNGMVDFIFDVTEIVTLPANREYYGSNDSKGNDSRPEEMVADACRLAAENGVDFSLYDNNNDGKVDNVFVFFAGEDEAEGADENCIWSHSWYLFSGAGLSVNLNGRMIDRYACTAEMTRIQDTSTGQLIDTRLSGIGTFCHEFSHTFGLPDLYDTDYEDQNGWAAGLWGRTSLMDSGNQNNQGNTPPNFNAIEREILGLSSPIVIETDGKFTISPISTYGEFYRINADTENEYYLLECRSDETGIWDAFIGGSGMLVYHIDKTESMIEKWNGLNTINVDPSHQCADLIEADGRSDEFTNYMDYQTRRMNLKGIFFPYYTTNSIPAQGRPGLNFWNSQNEDISIINIEKEESGKVNFSVIGFTEDSTPPRVEGGIQYEAFCDGAILKFETDRPHTGEATISYKVVGEEARDTTVLPYEEGKYAFMIEGLEPTKTYTASVYFVHNEIKGSTTSVSFMTKKKPGVSWPYIVLGLANTKGEFSTGPDISTPKNEESFEKGTRIPLKINNASEATDILWFFNRQPITHEGDHYYTLTESGTLKAHVYWENGQEYILVKEINIRE